MLEVEMMVPDNGNRNLVGLTEGHKARKILLLSEYEKFIPHISLIFDDKILAVTYSFIDGLFSESKKTLPTINDFLSKYSFVCDDYVISNIMINLNRLYQDK